jgi:hypothetical protein
MSDKQVTRLSLLTADLAAFAKSANAREALEAQNIPGSEKNKPAEVPDPASLGLDGNKTEAVPAGSTPTGTDNASSETDQARPGEKPLVAGNSAEVTPEQKPLTKSDLDKKAEETAKLADALTQRIIEHNKAVQKQASAAKPAPVVAKPAVVAAKPAQTKTAAPVTPFDLELTNDMLAKIGAIICATADGAAFAEQKVAEFIGAQEAQTWMGFLASQNAEAEKQASIAQDEYQAGANYAAELIALARNPLFKQGQELGAESLEAGGMPEGLPGEGVPSEGMPEGGMPEGIEGGDQEITPEDIVGALQILVQKGEIQPDQAAALLESLMGEGGGEVPPGAEVPPMAEGEIPAGGEGETPAETPAEPPAEPKDEPESTPEEQKAAAVKLASDLRVFFRNMKK